MRIIFLTLIAISIVGVSNAQKKRKTTKEYINEFKSIAIKEMKRTGIPASITLAQGIVESGSGNSRLAVKANNHFGIKCHDWTGPSIRHNDDKKNECFRVYKSAYQSYKDHSLFLLSKRRYAFLFDYDSDDYKRWARGLKKAGYATNPKYPKMLIGTIEKYKLYIYDKKNYKRLERDLANNNLEDFNKDKNSLNLVIDLYKRRVKKRNRLRYIIVREGDTYYSLEKNFDVKKWEVCAYNELDRHAKLVPGQILYLETKRRKAAKGYFMHEVKKGETVHEISQVYGLRTRFIYKYNKLKKGSKLKVGTSIKLRRRE